MPTPLSTETIRRAPKVLLHDHLDGGLRPATVVDLARETRYDGLPSTDPGGLEHWFHGAAHSGSLERYLQTFAHTVGVMQTPAALRRVAAECAVDLAADGVVYAEVRFAPELHTERGLTLEQVVDAVLAGFHDGTAVAAREGHRIRVGALLTAMRHAARSRSIAELAVRYRDTGAVGFDIAGAEAGYPPTRHLDAFEYLRHENAHFTIHAGEGFGLPSIWEAIQWCGADRLGHGVRIVDDITVGGAEVADRTGHRPADGATRGAGDGPVLGAAGGTADGAVLGRLAAYVRDRRIPLEMCPTSNVQTGAATSIAHHPIGLLRRLHFRVTVNTDNRLMSGASLTSEMAALVDAFGYDWPDLRWLTINAMKSAFIPFEERLALIDGVLKPGYDGLGGAG